MWLQAQAALEHGALQFGGMDADGSAAQFPTIEHEVVVLRACAQQILSAGSRPRLSGRFVVLRPNDANIISKPFPGGLEGPLDPIWAPSEKDVVFQSRIARENQH